jgi:hypothetical protein
MIIYIYGYNRYNIILSLPTSHIVKWINKNASGSSLLHHSLSPLFTLIWSTSLRHQSTQYLIAINYLLSEFDLLNGRSKLHTLLYTFTGASSTHCSSFNPLSPEIRAGGAIVDLFADIVLPTNQARTYHTKCSAWQLLSPAGVSYYSCWFLRVDC